MFKMLSLVIYSQKFFSDIDFTVIRKKYKKGQENVLESLSVYSQTIYLNIYFFKSLH